MKYLRLWKGNDFLLWVGFCDVAMSLHSTTVLQRLPELSIRLDSHSNAQIVVGDRLIDSGPYGLLVLQIFSRPTTVADAFAQLQNWTKSTREKIDLTGTVLQLYHAGLVVEEHSLNTQLASNANSFDSTSVHIKMLNDRQRTDAFIKAIQEVVKPSDVVLDLGTGSGILAIAAAKAGARHVYAIESGTSAKIAKEICAANGVLDRVTILEGWSTQLTLPEQADVLVTETLGNDPLGERILEFTLDAVRRLLKPNAQVIPSRLRLHGLPVTIPDSELQFRSFLADTLTKWKSWYEVDFRSLLKIGSDKPDLFYISPHKTRHWTILGDPFLIADFNLKENSATTVSTTTRSNITQPGLLNGVVVYFEVDLGQTAKLSTNPSSVNEDSCWSSPVWIISRAISVQKGQQIRATFNYRSGPFTEGLSLSEVSID